MSSEVLNNPSEGCTTSFALGSLLRISSPP